MTNDNWGTAVAHGDAASLDAWNRAWQQVMHFTGDPFVTLESANTSDEDFAMGSVFVGSYRALAGTRPDDPALQQDVERATDRARSPHERSHVGALTHLVDGNFTKAGEQWDDIASEHRDFAAIRLAHDAYLHVGDADRRLRSSQRALDSWETDEPGWGFIAGQLSFSLEETGFYDDAEQIGREALALDPLDLWARHALAHVYESIDDSDAAFALLQDHEAVWAPQDALAVHVWWHLALRLIAVGAYDEALAIYDAQIDESKTPYRLTDMASLLLRLEFVGVDVGDRWDVVADRYAARPEWHTAGFLDLHMALTYIRRPEHEAASRFFDGVIHSHAGDSNHPELLSENDHIFSSVVQPLVSAVRGAPSKQSDATIVLDRITDRLHLIGGSIAQRDLIGLFRSHYHI